MDRLKILKTLPCVVCGRTPVDIAHSNQSKHGKGRGLKADDYYTIPLCRMHHIEYDHFTSMNRSQSVVWFDKMHEKTNAMIEMLNHQEDVF